MKNLAIMVNNLGQLVYLAAIPTWILNEAVAVSAGTSDIGSPSGSVVSKGDGDGSNIQVPRRMILLVDDEAALIRSFARQFKRKLELRDDELLSAPDIESGIAVFDQNREAIQAILSDMLTPFGVGLDLYHHVRKTRPRLPFAFWSGGMPDHLKTELESILETDPQTIFFDKPVSVPPLLAWFQSALQFVKL